jgi:hypothetical protein
MVQLIYLEPEKRREMCRRRRISRAKLDRALEFRCEDEWAIRIRAIAIYEYGGVYYYKSARFPYNFEYVETIIQAAKKYTMEKVIMRTQKSMKGAKT